MLLNIAMASMLAVNPMSAQRIDVDPVAVPTKQMIKVEIEQSLDQAMISLKSSMNKNIILAQQSSFKINKQSIQMNKVAE